MSVDRPDGIERPPRSPVPEAGPPVWRTRTYDLIAAAPLIIWYSLAAAGCLILIWRAIATFGRASDAFTTLQIVKFAALFLFLAQQTILVFVRRLPVARADGVLPRLAALVGAYLGLFFVFLPPSRLSPAESVVSVLLVVVGTIGAIVSLGYLGRCFCLMPQARGLVTAGPYRFLRHPIYLAEQVAVLGVMLQFELPWSLVLAAASLLVQFPRMHYEEKVLSETYPSYRDYARRTARLLPGVY